MTPRLAALALTALLPLTACGSDESTATAGLVTVTGPGATYEVPDGFEEDDQGNVTHLVGSTEPEEWFEHETEDAIVQWYVMPAETSGATEEQVRSVIEQGLTNIAGSSPEQIVSFRETEGLGCLADGVLVGEPETREVGEGYALQYEYTCTSMSGPAHSIAVTSYGWDTRKHQFTVSATEEYWAEHEDELRAAAASFAVTD